MGRFSELAKMAALSFFWLLAVLMTGFLLSFVPDGGLFSDGSALKIIVIAAGLIIPLLFIEHDLPSSFSSGTVVNAGDPDRARRLLRCALWLCHIAAVAALAVVVAIVNKKVPLDVSPSCLAYGLAAALLFCAWAARTFTWHLQPIIDAAPVARPLLVESGTMPKVDVL